jgi:hypothetical protein
LIEEELRVRLSTGYLTQLQRHLDRLASSPKLWMPWNYREALA